MHTIDGDGVCASLYEYLWCKDEVNFSPHINVPDTVVYKYGQPVHWYFTGLDGMLKKKLRSNLTNVKIEDAFLKKKAQSMSHGSASSPSDIVAYYIYWEAGSGEGSDKKKKSGSSSSSCSTDGACMEYLDAAGLHDFLFRRCKQHNGILQAFIEPKGDHNALVRAVWTPKLCLTERRVNCRQLHDRRFGLHERAVTYDGPDIFSTARPLRGTILPTAVKRLCESTVSHVAEITFNKQRICRLALNLKLDAKDRLWLLWSSSIRLDEGNSPSYGNGSSTGSSSSRAATPDTQRLSSAKQRGAPDGVTLSRTPVTMSEVVRVPAHLHLRQEADHSSCGAPAPPLRVQCSSCGLQRPADDFHAVPYKTVVAHFEQVLDLAASHPEVVNGSGTVEWPPAAEVIAAAGGIGFGGAAAATSAAMSAKITAEDVTVPPVIRALHPKLAADAYSRHRRDPLFLYKTAEVCESCYLVYAELASLAFRTSSRRALTEYTASVTAVAQNCGKERRAPRVNREEDSKQWAWMPAPGTNTSAKLHRSSSKLQSSSKGGSESLLLQHSASAGSASGLQYEGRAAPELPVMLRSQSDIIGELSLGHLTGVDYSSSVNNTSANNNYSYYSTTGGGWDGATSVEDMIRQKEEEFFRDVTAAANRKQHAGAATGGTTNNTGTHPLEHLITSHRRLDCSTVPLHEVDPRAALEKRKKASASPYGQSQVLVEYLGHRSNATLINMKAEQQSAKHASSSSATGKGKRRKKPLPLSKSAIRHRDFLDKTLAEVQAQLGVPVLSPTAKTGTTAKTDSATVSTAAASKSGSSSTGHGDTGVTSAVMSDVDDEPADHHSDDGHESDDSEGLMFEHKPSSNTTAASNTDEQQVQQQHTAATAAAVTLQPHSSSSSDPAVANRGRRFSRSSSGLARSACRISGRLAYMSARVATAAATTASSSATEPQQQQCVLLKVMDAESMQQWQFELTAQQLGLQQHEQQLSMLADDRVGECAHAFAESALAWSTEKQAVVVAVTSSRNSSSTRLQPSG
jgi:hypothetical protein